MPEELFDSGNIRTSADWGGGVQVGPMTEVGTLEDGRYEIDHSKLAEAAARTLEAGKQAWPGGGS